ncbi:MAG: protein O-mannosyl-transferase family [Sandaracinaceae bacterium]
MMRPEMGLLPRRGPDPSVRVIALGLASGVPLAAYLATASAHGYWLDGGEFTAASIRLDIAHPPGHPLACLWGKLFTLVPLGPLPFRVALGQAVAAAGAAAFLYQALDTTLRCLGLERDRLVVPVALGGTWLVATSYAWWFQAVRPEVYALQALLVAVTIERLIALEAAWPTHDVRPLYTASLALGLGLANHHLVAFLAVPAFAPTLARVYRVRGIAPLARAALAVALGLAAYVYLPLRASTDPPANLGDPDALGRLYWVVSARVYAHDMGLEAVQPLGERFADVAVILVENLHPVPLVLAAAGLYALLRSAGTRRVGYVWAATLVVNLGARAWLGSVRSNPDILGYMMPGIAAVGALATAFVGAVLARVGQRPSGRPRTVAVAVALVVAALGLAQLRGSAERASLAGFHATDDFDDVLRRRLPPRSVVVLHDPQTVFRHWSLAAVEGIRPDVTVVPLPFLGYPGVPEALARRDPTVAELLRGYLVEGELRQPDLQSLAARRPLLIEMDVRVPMDLYETIVPDGAYYAVLDAGATDADVQAGVPRREATILGLTDHVGDNLDEAATRGRLLWMSYVDALYLAAVGERAAARVAVDRALGLAPASPELQGLAAVLAAPGEGPLDVAPFRVGPPPDR